MDQRSKYLWLTDTHVKTWSRYQFLNSILDEEPTGVFHSGDITEGFFLEGVLDLIGRKVGRPFIYTYGNHDLHCSDIQTVHAKLRALGAKHKNLIWVDEAGIVPLNEETAVIGSSGFYDAMVGNPDYIRYTFDWWMTKDFRQLPNMKARIEAFRELAKQSAETLSKRLEEALAIYKSVFLITHYPPWIEGHRATNVIFDRFWEPYNTNITLGKAIEKVMENHKKRHLTVLAGHVHLSTMAVISRSITLRVGKGGYTSLSTPERIYV
jgi:Icc-related predicted phosphoesterase